MVATLVKLKLTIQKNSLTRSTAQLVGAIIAGIMCVPLLAAMVIATVAAAAIAPDHLEILTLIATVIGIVIALVWAIGPLIFFSSDETLDPRRFVTLDVPQRQLAIGLLLSSLVGFGGVLTVVAGACLALVYLRFPVAALIGLVAAVIGVLTCVALSRLLTTLAARGLASRRGRDLTAGLSVLVIVLLSLSFSVLSNVSVAAASGGWWPRIQSTLRTVVDWLSWTPVGAAWEVPADIASGQVLMGIARLIVAAAWLVIVLWLWSMALGRAMVETGGASRGPAKVEENHVARAVSRPWARPATFPALAIMARCLRYWRRDPRYLTNLLTIPLMPVMFIVLAFIVPEMPREMALVGVPFAAWLSGFLLANDIGLDSTAFWVHVAADVPGRSDRWGRALALSAWCLPMLVVFSVVVAAVAGVHTLPAVLGMGVGLYGVSLGVSMIGSALVTFPAVLPGESPLATKSGSMGIRTLAQMGNSLISFALSIPVIVLAVLGLTILPWLSWVAFALGLAMLVVAVPVGVNWGGRELDKRKVTLLAQLVKADA